VVPLEQLGDLVKGITFCQRSHITAFWLSV